MAEEAPKKSVAGAWLSKKFMQCIGGLFMEQKGVDANGEPIWVASMGRVGFWIVFLHIMWQFHNATPLPAEETTVFFTLLGYQGVKVGKDAVSSWRKPSDPASPAAPASGPSD